MKNTITLLAMLMTSLLSFGQITWDQATADTARGFETASDISPHNTITFEKAGTYRWVRSYNGNCTALTYGIGDRNNSHLETTDSADLIVEANESFDIICHFFPNNTCCSEFAVVTLKVFKVDEPTITSTATYILDLWCRSLSTLTIDSDLFEIVPNPASDLIHISNITSVEKVLIYNALGQTVVNESNGDGQIDISGLTKGIYWVSVYSENKTLTKKFIKD